MYKTFAKSFKLLVSLGLFLLPLRLANACGISYMGEDYRVAFLNPYVIGEEYSAFFYSADYLNSFENDKKGVDRQRNCADWAAFAGNGVSASEVQAVVYGASYDQFLNALEEGAGSQQFGGNAFFAFLIQPENKATLEYLRLAKEYEHYSALEITDPWADPWDNDHEATQSVAERGKRSVRQKMEKRFAVEKNTFLKRRYAYQLLVMNRYAGQAKQFEQLYAAYFMGKQDALAAWATFHRAAVITDTVEQNYLMALSFRDCPEKRIYCYLHFDNELLDKTLAFCKNDGERAMVLGLTALHNPGRALDQIKKIQLLDANCPLLPLLLVRETNKLEDWLLTDAVTGMGTAQYPDDDTEEKWEWNNEQWETYRKANQRKDREYLVQVRDFVARLAPQQGGAVPADLANLLAGHLFFIDKKGAEGQKFLAAISTKTTAIIAEQQRTEQVLALLNRATITDAGTKEQLAKLLTHLAKVQKTHDNGKRDFAALNQLISQTYLEAGDLVTAYFFNNHSLDLPAAHRFDYGTAYYLLIEFLDWRASEADIDKVLQLLQKKDKSAFERYLVAAPLPSRNALHDLRGTIAFRKNDLTGAIAAFEKVDPDFWKTKYEFGDYLLSDPFTMAKDSLHRGEFPASKTAFVKRLVELENEAKANPARAADNYLALGTAWLNCSYYGKSWMMFCYGKSTYEKESREWGGYNYQPKSKEMAAVYYDATRAIAYLDKALAATTDLERIAQAEYLKARLRSWSYTLTDADQAMINEMDWGETGKFYFNKEMSFFKDWSGTYKSTNYYQTVANSCPSLVNYFGH